MINKKRVTYSIIDSTKKDGYCDILNSNNEYMATFKKYHDALDYISGYLVHKDIIDGEVDLNLYKAY